MTRMDSLHTLSDCRRNQGRRDPVTALLLITILSILSGRCRYRESAAFAQAHQDEFLTFFHLNRTRVASPVTLRAVITGVHFDEVNTALTQWARPYVTLEQTEWRAVDGQALGSTVTEHDAASPNCVSLVSVLSHKRGHVLGTSKLEKSTSSAIPTVHDLMDTVDWHGVIVTLDARPCQTKPSRPSSTAVMTM